jgi:DNA-binding NtrC family response regulator
MTAPVLVLVSEPQTRSQLSLLLRELGQRVHACSDPVEARQLCATTTYHRIIVERSLAGFNGLEVIQELRTTCPCAHYLLVAEEGARGKTPPPYKLGVSMVLFRPIDSRSTLKKLDAFCQLGKEAGSRPHISPGKNATTRPAQSSSSAPFTAFRKERATRAPFALGGGSPAGDAAKHLQKASKEEAALVSPVSELPSDTQTPVEPPQTSPAALPDPEAAYAAAYRPRYLLSHCRASRVLISQLWKDRNFKGSALIAGESGSEFELVARELLHAAGESLATPMYLKHDELTLEALASLNAQTSLREGPPLLVFIPSVQSISAHNAQLLLDFIKRNSLSNKRHVRLALGYAVDEAPEEGPTAPLLEQLLISVDVRLDVLPLRDRRSEIPYLVHKLLSDLVTLHPFLLVRSVDQQTLDYLQGYLWRGNFDQLVSVLRSAVSSCPHRVLCMQHMEPLLNSDLTTFHLLESAADQNLLSAQ